MIIGGGNANMEERLKESIKLSDQSSVSDKRGNQGEKNVKQEGNKGGTAVVIYS